MAKIGYFGIEGSYSYFAAREYFKDEGDFVSYPSFKDIFDAVLSGTVNYGVVPFKNNSAGAVEGVHDLLNAMPVKAIGEIVLPIEHCLLGVGNETFSADRISMVKKVYAHPQALAQCSEFLGRYEKMTLVSYQDNASAAKFVSESGFEDWAAIASEKTGLMYGLDVLARNISNLASNGTTFVVISH